MRDSSSYVHCVDECLHIARQHNLGQSRSLLILSTPTRGKDRPGMGQIVDPHQLPKRWPQHLCLCYHNRCAMKAHLLLCQIFRWSVQY